MLISSAPTSLTPAAQRCPIRETPEEPVLQGKLEGPAEAWEEEAVLPTAYDQSQPLASHPPLPSMPTHTGPGLV